MDRVREEKVSSNKSRPIADRRAGPIALAAHARCGARRRGRGHGQVSGAYPAYDNTEYGCTDVCALRGRRSRSPAPVPVDGPGKVQRCVHACALNMVVCSSVDPPVAVHATAHVSVG